MKSFSDSYKQAGVDVTAGYEAVKLMKKVQYNNPKEVNHYYRNIDNIFKTKKSNSDNIKN